MDRVAALLGGSGLPAAEARTLLGLVLAVGRESLIAHPERPVDAGSAARFAALVDRRRAGEPIAYLVGRREFYGRSFRVAPAVLVPRPETELLVDQVCEHLPPNSTASILDLGAGSGCLAITLGLERAAARVTALDRSADALAIARDNATALGAVIEFIESDWYAAIDPGARFDVIVSNPPYIAIGDPHLAALGAEPATALVAGPDGLDALRRVIAGSLGHLAPGGLLLVEHGADQGTAVRAFAEAAGLIAIATLPDAAGLDRACRARRKD